MKKRKRRIRSFEWNDFRSEIGDHSVKDWECYLRKAVGEMQCKYPDVLFVMKTDTDGNYLVCAEIWEGGRFVSSSDWVCHRYDRGAWFPLDIKDFAYSLSETAKAGIKGGRARIKREAQELSTDYLGANKQIGRKLFPYVLEQREDKSWIMRNRDYEQISPPVHIRGFGPATQNRLSTHGRRLEDRVFLYHDGCQPGMGNDEHDSLYTEKLIKLMRMAAKYEPGSHIPSLDNSL